MDRTYHLLFNQNLIHASSKKGTKNLKEKNMSVCEREREKKQGNSIGWSLLFIASNYVFFFI